MLHSENGNISLTLPDMGQSNKKKGNAQQCKYSDSHRASFSNQVVASPALAKDFGFYLVHGQGKHVLCSGGLSSQVFRTVIVICLTHDHCLSLEVHAKIS